MKFPESERVIYRRNPLESVICQLRFPTILSVEAQPPAKFQDRLRKEYPIFKEQNPGQNLGVPSELLKLVDQRLGLIGIHTYEFASDDSQWSVTLNKAAIALSCSKYERWETFRERLEQALTALEAEYAPAFYSRIGLRYTNVLKRSALGLGDSTWSHLLQPHIAGEQNTPQAADVEQSMHQIIWRLDEATSDRVKMQHGLTKQEGENEYSYFIDNDFFAEERTDTKAALARLDHFHVSAGQLFRYCITKPLHAAMEPIAVETGVAR